MTSLPTSALRKRLSLVTLLVLLAVLGWVAWSRGGRLGAPEATLEGRYRTEEQWLAAEIAQDIAEMALFASGRGTDGLDFEVEGAQPGQPPGVQVSFVLGEGERVHEALQWQRHIWAPEDYAGLARRALKTHGPAATGTPPSADEAMLRALLRPLAGVIETQNQRISGGLARSMRDPDAHEEAALLAGSLALREASGDFSDVRQVLCRMTAHLALADALRGAPGRSLSGRYAEAILSTLSGRTADALASLDGLQASAAGSPTQEAWLRALRTRITKDWRGMPIRRSARSSSGSSTSGR